MHNFPFIFKDEEKEEYTNLMPYKKRGKES
jgi:hypothetical protein